MTKPIYFPHTYISPATAAAIRSVFTAVAGYRPGAGRRTPDLQELAEAGFLEIVALAPDDEERLDRVLQEFERWGRMLQGGAGLLSVFSSNRPGSDPLTADGTAAQIASEIRRRAAGAPPAAQEALMRSAAFLQLAHEADRQRCEVSAELQRCARVHAELLDALAGEDAWPRPGAVAPPDGFPAPEGNSLLEQRVRAWARLFLQRPCAGPVFVTSSPEVVDLLAQKFPSLRRINRSALERTACPSAVPGSPDAGDFMTRLEMLASRPLPDAGPSDEGADDDPLVYAVPDVSPLRLFTCLAEGGEAPEAGAAATWRHTVVVEVPRRTPP